MIPTTRLILSRFILYFTLYALPLEEGTTVSKYFPDTFRLSLPARTTSKCIEVIEKKKYDNSFKAIFRENLFTRENNRGI